MDEGRCYAVERFVSLSIGDIRRRPADVPQSKKVRGPPKPEVATFDEVRDMRPAYNEIIVSARLTGASAAGESPARRKGYRPRRVTGAPVPRRFSAAGGPTPPKGRVRPRPGRRPVSGEGRLPDIPFAARGRRHR